MRFSDLCENCDQEMCVCDEINDFHDLIEAPKFEFRALCTSDVCSKTDLGVEKIVERPKETCPDCGYYLFWERKVA